MAKIKWTTKQDGITESLTAMLNRAHSLSALFNGPIYRVYQNAQIKRWESSGSSEGSTWAPVRDPEAKKIKYAAYPGGGRKTMVATTLLSRSAIGQNSSGIAKIATSTGLTVKINLGVVPYAAYPADARPYMQFGKKTITQMRDMISKYVKSGR